MLFRVAAVLLALMGAAGAIYCGFQVLLTLAYGMWSQAALFGLGLSLACVMLAVTPWFWRQASS